MKMTKGVTRQLLGEFHGIRGEIVSHQVWGIPANALALYLPEARNALSGRQGFKEIEAVCNCHLPKPLCQSLHERYRDWETYFGELLTEVLIELNLSPDRVAVLSTGVNMEHLAWAEEVYKELWALAFVTAGIKTNAMRIGKDRASTIERNGQFEEAGTINIIVLTNASFDQAALASSFITITEAKIIALQELNVRSSYNPDWQATGTGTDQIIVVSGRDTKQTYVGGHTKIGELTARAVTRATIDAINKRLNVSD
ncbi:MAG TPA: adenosylcobinamide amidohydrolase [Dehalococcoidia bacterium]|nr:adenosylcobinamide amidohydrolase [Dehalococcoidia bacterium]